MGVLLIPLAFAGAGGLLFGNVGMAAGWLIGAWLFGPKAETQNQIFDPGAQEMPRFNQSLRGVTVPILFGTNRVSSNIVWVKNFQTIRHETSSGAGQGGGKGGGSGGGGKSGGGQQTGTQVSYEYKWDMLFHIGMSPEPYGLFGGWSNTQRIAASNIEDIGAGSGGVQSIITCNPGAPILSALSPCTSQNVTNSVNGGAVAQQGNNTASLTFDDSFYGAGGATNDSNYDNWDYFEAQEGTPTRWPFTEYVGFKGLSLGSTPTVPQLSWEIGPGTAVFNCDTQFLGSRNKSTSSVWGLYGTNSMMVGEDNRHYILINDGTAFNQDLVLYCMDTDTTITIDSGSGPNMSGTDTDSVFFPCGGSQYFMWVQWSFPGGSTVDWAGTLYKINASGTLEVVRSDGGSASSSHKWMFKMTPKAFAWMSFDGINKHDTGYLTWICDNGDGAQLFVLEPLGTKPDGYPQFGNPISPNPPIDPLDSGALEDRFLTLLKGDNIFQADDGGPANTSQRAFILPEYHPDSGLTTDCNWPIWYKMCIYIPRAMYIAQHDSPITTSVLGGTYQDGGIYSVTILGGISGAEFPGPCGNHKIHYASDPGNEQGFNAAVQFFAKDGTAFFPIADGAKNKDGTENREADYMAPTISPHSSGAVVLVWPKRYATSADLTSTGALTKIIVQVWNPISKTATTYAEQECSVFDQLRDLGLDPDVVGNVNLPQDIVPFFDPAYGLVLAAFNYLGGSADIGNQTVTGVFGPLSIGGGQDVLPPYIIYQILTNPVFGMGIDPANIDQDSYALALQYCDSQDIRVSVQYTREESVLNIIDELLSLYGGYIIDSGGSVKFGVQQFTSVPVRTIDNSRLVVDGQGNPPVTVTKGALQDGYNKVRVNYFDRNLDYRQNQVEVGDEVDQDFNGIRFKEFQPRFVMKAATAQKIAERALWTNLYTRDQYAFKLGWGDADLEPGDVITLVDSFHPELSTGKTVRIVKRRESQRGLFDINAVLEVAYAMTAAHSDAVTDVNSAGDTKGTNVPVLPPLDFRMYELPREFQASQSEFFVGYNQQSNVRGAALYLSPDGVSYAQAATAEPFIISGIFAKALPSQSQGDMERNVDVWLLPTSGFSADTPTFCQTVALDDVSELMRASGTAFIFSGSEALAVEGLTLLGQNHYRINRLYRGWGGTLSQAHSSGAYWHKHGAGVFAQEIDPNKIGTNIWYKVVPYNFGGQQYDVSSIEGKQYQIRGWYWLPDNMPDFDVVVASAAVNPGTPAPHTSPLYAAIPAVGKSDVTFQWPDGARLEGYGFGGYGIGGFGHFASDVDIHRWRVEIVSGNTVVRSTAVDSGSFTYTVAQNSADFNGFAGVYGVRIVPFNSYGDAEINAVRSINLFW